MKLNKKMEIAVILDENDLNLIVSEFNHIKFNHISTKMFKETYPNIWILLNMFKTSKDVTTNELGTI